jgi:hypothetical protein
MPASMHPPKPRLTLRVGVTGHRPNKLHGSAVARVAQQLPQVFAALEQAAANILQDSASLYAPEAAAIRLITGFAEGADQMAVAVCPAGWQIEAILPFPRGEYLQDFAQSAGDGRDVRDEFRNSLAKAAVVTELPYPQSANRDQGYAAAGGYLLRQIDVLIAVWDGKPPKPGGTGAIAREASAGGIPVVWLSTEGDTPPRLITHFTRETPTTSDRDCSTAELTAALAPIFVPPARSSGHRPDVARAGLERFLGETWKPRCLFTAYDTLRRVANGRLPRLVLPLPSFAERCRDWDSFLKTSPQALDLQERIRRVLLPRYAFTDALAVYYSHLYRSAYVLSYVLSALAVFIALGTVFIHDDPHAPAREVLGTKAVFVGCELIVISGIILLIWLGRYRLWHERWLNYRALAEALRHGRFLAFVSEFGRIGGSASAPGDRAPPWMLWYIRATMREVGLPTATLDGDYQRGILKATREDEIEGPHGQLAYNKHNIESAHHIDHFLHRLGTSCFIVTFLLLVAFLLLFGLDRALGSAPLEKLLLAVKPLVTFLSAGLPALGAAVAGIRVHGGFEGSAERSAHTLDQLAGLTDDYDRATTREPHLEDTAELLLTTARVLSEDIAAWQDLYGRKRLVLPA